jgi:predicted hotdog family 3-hydroxylacyl-ACP dehydratase
MDFSSVRIGELLPHGPRMTLLDRLESYTPTRSVVAAHIDARCVFFDETGVPAWAGIEYMSQAVAAHAGYEARLRGEPPAVGFVLGTRVYESLVDEFPSGCTLSIGVEPQALEGGFGAFMCAIEIERVIARAVVNVYRPSADELARLREASAAR